jgi:hypothetical protein
MGRVAGRVVVSDRRGSSAKGRGKRHLCCCVGKQDLTRAKQGAEVAAGGGARQAENTHRRKAHRPKMPARPSMEIAEGQLRTTEIALTRQSALPCSQSQAGEGDIVWPVNDDARSGAGQESVAPRGLKGQKDREQGHAIEGRVRATCAAANCALLRLLKTRRGLSSSERYVASDRPEQGRRTSRAQGPARTNFRLLRRARAGCSRRS